MKNSFWLGCIFGVFAPLLAYLLSTFTNLQAIFFSDKPIAIYVIAAVINLLIVRFTYRAEKHSMAKGVVMVTFIAMLVLVLTLKLKV